MSASDTRRIGQLLHAVLLGWPRYSMRQLVTDGMFPPYELTYLDIPPVRRGIAV